MSKKVIEARAQLWRRIVAYLIDMIIASLIIVVPIAGSGGPYKESFIKKIYTVVTSAYDFSWSLLFKGLAISVLIVAYFVLFEFMLQQTVGKMFMKIEVKSLKDRLTLSQVIMRNWTKFSNGILFLDSLVVFFGRSHQRTFERISRTEVVIKREAVK